jgi:hypothetical protein
MRDEHRAERLHEMRRDSRAVDAPILEKPQDRVRAVQRIPAAAALEPLAQRLLRLERRRDVARVRDEKIGFGERLQVRIVLEHAHAHALVAREQLEQLEPCKVDVVVLAARNQHAADLLPDIVRHVTPRSMRRARAKARKNAQPSRARYLSSVCWNCRMRISW